jgi:hypothetical protein
MLLKSMRSFVTESLKWKEPALTKMYGYHGNIHKNGTTQESISGGRVCKRCHGTGMICGYKPEISPDNCRIDFLNTICPDL